MNDKDLVMLMLKIFFSNPYFWGFQLISVGLLLYLSGDYKKIINYIKEKLKWK